MEKALAFHSLSTFCPYHVSMKVCVTGADGLLGNNLVRELLSLEFKVSVLLPPQSQCRGLNGLSIEKYYADLGDPSVDLNPFLAGCDYVFHCAAITDLKVTPHKMNAVNVQGTLKVIQACLKNNVKKLIFVGSASSFIFNEQGNFSQIYQGNAYIESKKQATQLVLDAVKNQQLHAVVVAPTFMLGPFDSRPSSGEIILKHLKLGLPVTIPGGRNFVHVKDVAQGMILAAQSGKSGEIYIIGNQNLSYKDFFSLINKKRGLSPKLIVLPKFLIYTLAIFCSGLEKILGRKFLFNYQMAKIMTMNAYYSSHKAIDELKIPQTPITHAIEDSLQSLKTYGFYHERIF